MDVLSQGGMAVRPALRTAVARADRDELLHGQQKPLTCVDTS